MTPAGRRSVWRGLGAKLLASYLVVAAVGLLTREALTRSAIAALLSRALPHLGRPSRLANSPLGELAAVREQAAALVGYRFSRAHMVIRAVRRAYEFAWAELGETEDACCLVTLADALAGRSREEFARKAGWISREITRRRREAIDMIVDHLPPALHGS